MDDTASPIVLEIDDLGYVYPDGTEALTGLSMRVRRGERIALLGPNGAGKSTLILHLNGILMAAAGAVRVAGTPITRHTVREVRAKVGLVFQDPDDQLFMTSVHDDVAFGPLNAGLTRSEADHRVHDALHAVGLADVATKPGQHLSFGQKKRVALATVLSMSPDILVLDEPTSNLDPRAKRHMLELLGSMDATMIVATHDMELAWRLCSRAVIVDAGRLVADGPVTEILRNGPLLEAHGLELPASLRAEEAKPHG